MLAGAVCNGFGEFLLYGGYPGSGGQGALGDVWELSLRDPVTWIALSPAGTAPPPRWSFGAVYRSAGGRVVIYGGFGGGSGDTWTLDFGSVHPPTVRFSQPRGGLATKLSFWALANRCQRRSVQCSRADLAASFDSSRLAFLLVRRPARSR
jgi:hypothetical protein